MCSAPPAGKERPLWRGGGGGGRHHRLPLGGVRRPHGAELLRRDLVWAQQVARLERQLEGEDVRGAAQRLGVRDLAKQVHLCPIPLEYRIQCGFSPVGGAVADLAKQVLLGGGGGGGARDGRADRRGTGGVQLGNGAARPAHLCQQSGTGDAAGDGLPRGVPR